MNAGIKFTDAEFEAMCIMDKVNNASDNYSKYFSSTLSVVVKQANELVGLYYKVDKV